MERSTVRVRCLEDERNTIASARARARTARYRVQNANHWLPHKTRESMYKINTWFISWMDDARTSRHLNDKKTHKKKKWKDILEQDITNEFQERDYSYRKVTKPQKNMLKRVMINIKFLCTLSIQYQTETWWEKPNWSTTRGQSSLVPTSRFVWTAHCFQNIRSQRPTFGPCGLSHELKQIWLEGTSPWDLSLQIMVIPPFAPRFFPVQKVPACPLVETLQENWCANLNNVFMYQHQNS